MNRIEKRVEKLRNRVVSTFSNLLVEKAYEEITMEEIAELVDVSKATLYKYFPNKGSILKQYVPKLFKSRQEMHINTINDLTTLDEKVEFYYKVLLEGVKKEPVLFEHFLLEQTKGLLKLEKNEESSSMIEPLIHIMKQHKEELSHSLTPHILVELFWFGFIQIAKVYYQDLETTDILRKMTNLFVEASRGGNKNEF